MVVNVDSVIREIQRRQGHAFGAWRPYAGADSGLVACVCDTCGAQLVISTTTGDASGWAAARSCAQLVAEREEREVAERARAVRWTIHQAAEARKARAVAMQRGKG